MSSWNPDRLSQFDLTQPVQQTQYAESPEIGVRSAAAVEGTRLVVEEQQAKSPAQVTQPAFGISPWSPWSQDQFIGLFNAEKKMARSNSSKRKIGNGKSTLVARKKKPSSSSKQAPKLPPAAAVMPTANGSPPMPPLRAGVDNRRGVCEVMGNEKCPYPNLENYRHKCSSCGLYVHAIAPCTGAQTSDGALICSLCVAVEERSSDGEESEDGKLSPDMLAASKASENVESDDEEDDDDEDETQLAATSQRVPAAAPRQDIQQRASRAEEVSQLLNGTQQKERQKRGKNFTPEEDECLSQAWVSTTMDSRNGSDQRQSDFNKKLYSNFQDLVEDLNGDADPPCPPLPMDRKQKSVVARFGTIKQSTFPVALITFWKSIGKRQRDNSREIKVTMDLSQRSSSGDKTGGSSPNKFSGPSSSAAQAASSLALLLQEDILLADYNLHVSGKTEEVAFAYSAALLQNEEAGHVTQKATDALAEVQRKLALVESLAERVSRTSPAAVAAPLLRLHGYEAHQEEEKDPAGTSNATTLTTIRERGERIKRQGEVLDGVARRVETSLKRGMKRMETVTSRLSRVLALSATLKMILRVKFESSKLDGYDLEDSRDLTRAAASVAVIEDLLSRPELNGTQPIQAVEDLRPSIVRTASAVRAAAAKLLESHNRSAAVSTSSVVLQLGTTLQVYYHLGELPQAAWSAVDHAIASVQKVTSAFFSAKNITSITDDATSEAKRLAGSKFSDAQGQRMLKKQLKDYRAAAASKWATGITDAALRVWNLHRVLCRKTDPAQRLVYVDVVSQAEIPDQYKRSNKNNSSFIIFSAFWEKMCEVLASRLMETLEQDSQKLAADTAALYPAARTASLEMMGFLSDTMQSGVGTVALDDGSSSSPSGILGGSVGLDDQFIGWSSQNNTQVAEAAGLGMDSADSWTRTDRNPSVPDEKVVSSASALSLSVILQSPEWKLLEGSKASQGGLYPLQSAFQEESMKRLCAPLQFMFPENIALDETGMEAATLPMLPSKYDVQRFDTIVREELSTADKREGGGDLSAIKMIAGSICEMVRLFCKQAQNAVCSPPDSACLTPEGSTTTTMQHDVKVTKILYTLTTYLRQTPEKVFIAPYKPATSPQHEEAARICQSALMPAINTLDQMVKTILSPLIRALNQRVASMIARIHAGAYHDESQSSSPDAENLSFVQKHLSKTFDAIAANQLAKLPPDYGATVASAVAAFSMYTFVSNVALIRPLSTAGRLAVVQDLADFELILDQFVVKCGSSLSLGKIEGGKPYSELRAVRMMLFWNGLENKENQASAIAKTMLRESWIKDVRTSTVCHYLFSYAPSLLSSPHHSKRMREEEYVGTMVGLDAGTEEGEAKAWMAIMACCDAYQQRESVERGGSDGDPRVASILMTLGPELLRGSRRH
ncbi:Component of oligomeric golgi complex 5 [Seminavis robusta]|uniref:Component of oligomeric golgi complex 5 n=1 Tax=Seminavis robusta TaxID=568900 RepID=A0A9N8HAJ7_9STRA|nr:Component of oligomeric golgi complex 5 [Seminavis robusta]|eukprot:Sro151_g069020.1 Component of oligomeric golgi complex 5 (1407) ;mRNA; f:1982-6702